MSWVLHRIDDRLIHGQVLVAWGARLTPTRIVLVDDAVAASEWERQLYLDSAPGIDVQVLTVAAAASMHAGEAAAPGHAFMVVRDLATARRLAEAGAEVGVWNVGGLHYSPGKDKFGEYVYLDAADRDDAKALIARGVSLEVQDVPASRAQSLTSLDPSLSA